MKTEWRMKIGEETRLVFIDYQWQCQFCMKPMSLPGIAPDLKTLMERGWKYCPYCGRVIDYKHTIPFRVSTSDTEGR